MYFGLPTSLVVTKSWLSLSKCSFSLDHGKVNSLVFGSQVLVVAISSVEPHSTQVARNIKKTFTPLAMSLHGTAIQK